MASTYWAVVGLLALAALFAALRHVAASARRGEPHDARAVHEGRQRGRARGAAERARRRRAVPPRRSGGRVRRRAAVLARQHAARRSGRVSRADGAACDGHPRLLVNRGWVPAGADRRVLPTSGSTRAPAPSPGASSGCRVPACGSARDDDSGGRRPVVVLQYPTAATLARRLGEPVFDYQVLLDTDAPDGYVRRWQVPGVAPERHLSYAGQWCGAQRPARSPRRS